MKNQKAELTIQSIFFIMMIIFLIWIVQFGISKMFFAEDTISEQERIELKNYLIKSYSFCDDSLNKGTFKNIEIKNNRVNVLCELDKSILDTTNDYNQFLELITLYENGENTVLINGDIINGEINSITVLDAFNSKINFSETNCFIKENNKRLEIKIQC